MEMVKAKSKDANKAYELVKNLQSRFVNKLDYLSETIGEDKKFEKVTWLRDEGMHGGGSRFEFRDEKLFNSASVNVSQVHYDDLPTKSLQSATAISTIIHPKNPHVPSIHMHISLTELCDGTAYWRIMADLNPSIFNEEDKKIFDGELKKVTKKLYKEGARQGEKYFNIPALQRHRGVSHFYLEGYSSENKEDDFSFAQAFGEHMIDTYIDIISTAFTTRTSCSSKEINQQLRYHTLYLFQVLTLDRGTTSGLLIHNQNDLGILSSLPAYVDRTLLLSWAQKVPAPQDELVKEIVNAINLEGKIDDSTKLQLAFIVREHYKKYPEALELKSSEDKVPPTIEHHSTL